ncbi:hypothetical protein [Oerskovia flava]|uniref:hypothetical protein n=1 Tax=Oerskovia flava TaxID=2986422 RepID=UPI00223FF724|nr:hypothetical protein [Oerskovia sp. JB1-3-2]
MRKLETTPRGVLRSALRDAAARRASGTLPPPGQLVAGNGPGIVPPAVPYDPSHRAELARRARDGTLVRVRRGVYLPGPPTSGTTAPDNEDARDRDARILAQVRGVADRFTTPYWFSHETAALLWGCWTWRTPPLVHLTQLTNPRVQRTADPGLRRHWTPLPTRDQGVLDGVPVTSLERTVVDCARSLPPAGGLVVADSALRLGLDVALVDRVLEEAAGTRGVVRARRVLGLVDPGSGSPGETLVRLAAIDAGCPTPVSQVAVRTRLGTFWVDLGWPELRVGIEFDGAAKYSGGQFGDPEQVRRDEQDRHAALVAAGWWIVRVTWADLADPVALGRRLWDARRRRPPR